MKNCTSLSIPVLQPRNTDHPETSEFTDIAISRGFAHPVVQDGEVCGYYMSARNHRKLVNELYPECYEKRLRAHRSTR
jgi:hypothetical protein